LPSASAEISAESSDIFQLGPALRVPFFPASQERSSYRTSTRNYSHYLKGLINCIKSRFLSCHASSATLSPDVLFCRKIRSFSCLFNRIVFRLRTFWIALELSISKRGLITRLSSPVKKITEFSYNRIVNLAILSKLTN